MVEVQDPPIQHRHHVLLKRLKARSHISTAPWNAQDHCAGGNLFKIPRVVSELLGM